MMDKKGHIDPNTVKEAVKQVAQFVGDLLAHLTHKGKE